MPEPIVPAVGWGVLHLFCRPTTTLDGDAVIGAVKQMEADDYQVVTVAILGHKADLGLMAIGPDLWRLRRFQTEIVAAGLDVVDSYVSLTEVSDYAQEVPEAMKQARLYPRLPPRGQADVVLLPDVEAPAAGRQLVRPARSTSARR